MTGDLLDLDGLDTLGDERLRSLRQRLANVGYDAAFVARLESIAPRRLDAVRLPLVHAWLEREAGPAAIAAAVFGYRDERSRAELTEVLGAETVDDLLRCGALRSIDDRLQSRLRLMPFAGLLIGSDEADASADPVMGPGATTQELLRALPTSMPSRVLDVGCGAGSLALAAKAAGADTVIAVDLDPRAVQLTRFNARLNDLVLEARQGDLLAPVEGEHFDLVIAQPPFVPQPPSIEATTFLHGGQRGDELALRLLEELSAMLSADGRALVLMDTAPPAGQSVTAHLQRAVGNATQLVIIDAAGHASSELAIGYAAAAHSDLGPAYARAALAYAEHLEALGVEGTRHALVSLRSPAPGQPAFAVAVEPRTAHGYDAKALADLDAALALATLPPEQLLQHAVQVPPRTRLVQAQPLGNQGTYELRIEFNGGRARDQVLSDAAAMLLELVARTSSIAALVDEYAQACKGDAATVQAAVLDFVRSSLVKGMLMPAQETNR